MVDTRTRNNISTPSGALTNTSVSTVEQSGCQESTMLEDSPVRIWQTGPHPPQIPIISVKQEPMDIERVTRSPNNDSGISPDHGSSGSSAGRPSPGQGGSFGSPEYFNVQESQRTRSEHTTESSTSSSQFPNVQHHITQNIPPIWEVSVLALGGGADNTVLEHSPLKHSTENSEPDHPHQQQTTSPPSRNNMTQNHTPNTSPLHCLKSLVTPIANGSLAVNHNPDFPVKTPPLSVTNVTSVLSTSFSDDNSMSSSTSSSTLMFEGQDESYKITLPEGQQNPLRCLEMAVEQSSIMGGKRVHGVASGAGASSNGVRNIYQCPLCEYNTLSRTDFNEHNKTHCPDQKCSKCDFLTKDVAELEIHLTEHHMIPPGIIQQIVEADEDQAGIRVPRVNSQGKVKTFRCKHCNFVAVTKLEYWNHYRCHIKKDKILTCPRCPFVTEYKHHLEYHLRNHANSKPYQCSSCPYICVNKSMLNSHLKSHSNVCQYRCATCKYETKYLHSLKVHLRKYKHSPAMVLNPDGTPNPEPIIDVYGTRRGPKQRPRNTIKSTSKENNNDIPLPYHAPQPLPIFQPSYPVIPQPPRDHPLAYPYNCIMSHAFTANNNNNSLLPKFPQPDMCAREKNTEFPDLRRNSSNENSEHFLANISQYEHMSKADNNNKNNVSGSNDIRKVVPEQSVEEEGLAKRYKLGAGEELLSCKSKEVEGDPLDLSKPESMNVNSDASVSYVIPSILHKSTSMKTSKHRRKGQAYKLEHITWKLQQSYLSENGRINKNYPHMSESEPKTPAERTDNLINTHAEEDGGKQHPQSELMEMNEDLPKTGEESSTTHANNSVSGDNAGMYRCPHCDIIFNDFLMYSIHKGYHGYKDPFTCNMCGVKTANKVEFFLHIHSSSHS